MLWIQNGIEMEFCNFFSKNLLFFSFFDVFLDKLDEIPNVEQKSHSTLRALFQSDLQITL